MQTQLLVQQQTCKQDSPQWGQIKQQQYSHHLAVNDAKNISHIGPAREQGDPEQ